MSRRLGEFDQAVLQAVALLEGRGYGVPIRQYVSSIFEREVSIAAVYASLAKFEELGLISSRLGESTPQRGGRAKRYYQIEASGYRVLKQARSVAERLWGWAEVPA